MLKSFNKIDTSKLNFKLPLTKTREENIEKPNWLRMSSNAVLLRAKASTPLTQVSHEPEVSPCAQLSSAEISQKYFKRKAEKVDRVPFKKP